VIIFTNHAAMRHVLANNDPNPRLIRWVSFLSEFNIDMKDKKGFENSVTDHLSTIFIEYIDVLV